MRARAEGGAGRACKGISRGARRAAADGRAPAALAGEGAAAALLPAAGRPRAGRAPGRGSVFYQRGVRGCGASQSPCMRR